MQLANVRILFGLCSTSHGLPSHPVLSADLLSARQLGGHPLCISLIAFATTLRANLDHLFNSEIHYRSLISMQ